MKKPAFIIGFLVISVIILSVVRIYVSNNISTSGVILGKVEEELNYYKTQNILLSEKVYSQSSLTNIASKASELGFVDSGTNFVLSGQLPIAKR